MAGQTVLAQSGLPAELTDGDLLKPTPGKTPDKPDAKPEDKQPDLAADNTPSTVTDEQVGLIPADAIEKDPKRIAALWRIHWRLYAMRTAQVGNEFYTCATYDARYPSSRHVTVSQLMSRATQVQKIRSGNLIKTREIAPDRDDAKLAAESIMEIKAGEYGYITSAKVDKVVGPDEMIISNIQLIDSKQVAEDKKRDLAKVPQIRKRNVTSRSSNRYRGGDSRSRAAYDRYQREKERRAEREYELAVRAREDLLKRIAESYEAKEQLVKIQSDDSFKGPVVVKGFPTARVKAGGQWTGDRPKQGPQIAIVGTDGSGSRSRTSSSRQRGGRLVAMPAYLFRKPLSESQFLAMLESRNVSVAEFVNQVLKAKQRNRGQSGNSLAAEPIVFDWLESRRGSAKTQTTASK